MKKPKKRTETLNEHTGNEYINTQAYANNEVNKIIDDYEKFLPSEEEIEKLLIKLGNAGLTLYYKIVAQAIAKRIGKGVKN